jgi:hypothetical protein
LKTLETEGMAKYQLVAKPKSTASSQKETLLGINIQSVDPALAALFESSVSGSIKVLKAI